MNKIGLSISIIFLSLSFIGYYFMSTTGGVLALPPTTPTPTEQKDAYADSILNNISAQMKADHNMTDANFIQHLRELDLQGKINCQHPQKIPFSCELAPKLTR